MAQIKGISDLWRTDKVVRNARDAFVTEHMEIVAYEVLERLANTQTAEVAREIRAEEEAMAERLASKWDSFLDMTLRNE